MMSDATFALLVVGASAGLVLAGALAAEAETWRARRRVIRRRLAQIRGNR